MPLTKEKAAEYGRMGGIARVKNHQRLADFLADRLNDTGVTIFEKLERVAESGEELTDSQKFALKEMREWAPFAIAKKTESKTDVTSDGKALALPTIQVVVSDK